MPRPPSKHGLEKKFKPWRKGKSTASAAKHKTASCLKNQLRGQERLLARFETGETSEKTKELLENIQSLKKEISDKAELERQRQHAQKSHGVRFLERQRLFRMEKATRKLLVDAKDKHEKARYQQELTRIALDQAYVAHFPHDQKYLPIFRKGARAGDDERTFMKRVITRSRILRELKEEEKVDWISKTQYKLLPTQDWTAEMEKELFGAPVATEDNKSGVADKRFAVSARQEKLLEEAQNIENRITNEESSLNDSSEEDSGSDDSSEATAKHEDQLGLATSIPMKHDARKLVALVSAINNSSSDSDGSSDSSDDDTEDEKAMFVNNKRSLEPAQTEAVDDEDFDDFLMPANHENHAIDVFKKAKQDRANRDFVSGDKSQGWKTQRQKPGEFKKPRVRK